MVRIFLSHIVSSLEHMGGVVIQLIEFALQNHVVNALKWSLLYLMQELKPLT